jgi:hypothetical protein
MWAKLAGMVLLAGAVLGGLVIFFKVRANDWEEK